MSSKYQTSLYAAGAFAAALIMWFAAHSARRIGVKSYPMTGTLVEIHLESHTARVYNDNIPGLMEPMAMDYQVPDPASLHGMKKGDKIRATLATDRKDVWRLENIVVQPTK